MKTSTMTLSIMQSSITILIKTKQKVAECSN
jgi:hypothetical protein